MNDIKIAAKAQVQLENFLGKIFTHFSKAKMRFLYEAMFGILASGDTKLSSIVRALDDNTKPIYTEKRLSRNIDDDKLGGMVSTAILEEGAKHVFKDTLIIADPFDICKEHAWKMEHITRVRDASRPSKDGSEVIVNGYHGCAVVACKINARKTIPLALKVWSSLAPGHKGENDEVLQLIDTVYESTGGKGILVYDRGGDRGAFYDYLLHNNRDFVIRIKSRGFMSWGGLWDADELAQNCTMQHSYNVHFDSHGKDCNIQLHFGVMPVKLPDYQKNQLHLVVVKGFGQRPMMLVTSLDVNQTFESQWRIVSAYLSRWRIEETIRFMKQEYGLENIRVLGYNSIRNMATLVLACAYFASVWIGRHLKHEVLAEHLIVLGKRLNKVPEFAAYAISSGIKRAFSRFAKLTRKTIDILSCKTITLVDKVEEQFLPGFAELFDIYSG